MYIAGLFLTPSRPSKTFISDGYAAHNCIPFGRGAAGIAFDTGRTYTEASQWLKRYWKEHPQLKKYLENIPQEGWVTSPTGMKRYATSWTQAKNHGIQNSACVVLLTALNLLTPKASKWGCPVDLCIHDSIRMDLDDRSKLDRLVPQIKEIIEFESEEMFDWLPLPLTVDFSVGENWGTMVKYEKASS